MIHNERELTSAFSYYLRKHKPLPDFLKKSYAVEFKWLKKNRLNFNSDLRPQQVPSLLQVRYGCFYSKISDMSLGAKGFDGFNICNSDAWLAVCWDKILYFIDADTIHNLSQMSKSITREELISYSSYDITL